MDSGNSLRGKKMPPDAVLVVNPLGVSIIKDNRVEASKLFSNIDEAAEKFEKAMRGELIEEVKAILEEARTRGYRSLAVEPPEIISALRDNYPEFEFIEISSPLNLENIFVEKGLVSSVEEYREKIKEITDKILAAELKKAVARRDMMIVHGVHVLEDLDKQINIFYTRCREWYGIHFPELVEIIDEPEEYMRVVAELGARRNYTLEKLKNILGEKKARLVMERAESSIGAEISEEDEEQVKKVAREGLRLIEMRRDEERYLRELMNAEAPNLAAVAGPTLGAKLISIAGGLEKLAKLPASTIQVLGAEKALFRFFKTGRGAPKHGVIFQHPYIHGSPKWQRGKIARLLASKISIAARIDYFSREDRSGELRRALEDRLAEIKRKYAQPPPKKAPKKKRKKKKRKR